MGCGTMVAIGICGGAGFSSWCLGVLVFHLCLAWVASFDRKGGGALKVPFEGPQRAGCCWLATADGASAYPPP